MNNPVRVILCFLLLAYMTILLVWGGHSSPGAVPASPLPAGLSDPGPAEGLSTPSPEAIVFDLRYRARNGSSNDIPWNSFWGYGTGLDEAKKSPFLGEVRKKAPKVLSVYNPSLKGRALSAVEYKGKDILAFYFDVDADGTLDAGERLASPKTLRDSRGYEFITPDFMNTMQEGGSALTRVILRATIYEGGAEPNCMWSPAAMMEAKAMVDGKSMRLFLLPSSPGEGFSRFGSSRYALQTEEAYQAMMSRDDDQRYLPAETLSSLICNSGRFYRLALEGRRTNGLPARALLTPDKSPTGFLAATLSGKESLKARLTGLYLSGVSEKNVFFRCDSSKEKVTLPEGTYALSSGSASYGGKATPKEEWSIYFSSGPQVAIKAGETVDVALGQPALQVRAVDETRRYERDAASASTFKKGARIYLEPRITGKGKEVFTRFRQGSDDRPPTVTITGPDGKQMLSKTMEYG